MSSTPAKSVTIRDIAQACGVGKSAVASALYGYGRISAETRGRILQTAEAMGYNAAQHTVARRLAMRKSSQQVINHIIGLFATLLTQKDGRPSYGESEYLRRMTDGIAGGCVSRQYAILLTHAHLVYELSELQALLPSAFARGDSDGAIFIGSCGSLITPMRRLPGFARQPAVTLINPYPGSSSVTSDDRIGTYAAMRHLLREGHRHFLVLYDPDEDRLIQNRMAGVRAALTEAGLDPAGHIARLTLPTLLLNPTSAPRVLPVPGLPVQHIEPGADLLLPFLRQHPEITAILCQNDPMALHLWHMLTAAGWRVPDDISLVGFDDTDGILDPSGTNHLTTIRLPLFDMGRAAAEILIQRITGELTEDIHQVLPVEFIPRLSTAPPKKR